LFLFLHVLTLSNLKAKLLRNLGANAYGQLITVAIQLASVPLFLHYWGVELYGEWLILSAIPVYLSISDIGFASVAANDMTMRIAKGDKQGALEVYQSIWLFISAVSLTVGSVLALLIYTYPVNEFFSISYISTIHTQQLLIVLILTVLLGLQNSVFSAAFRATGHYAYGAVTGNTIRLVEWLMSMTALILSNEVVIVALSVLVIRLFGLLVMWIMLRRQAQWLNLGFKFSSRKKIRELTKPALAFMAFPLGLALSLQSMVIIIGLTLGSSAVVIFSAYRTLTRLLVQIITMINQSIWPEVSAAYGAGKMELVTLLHRKSSSVTFWIALAAVTTLSLIGEWMIGIWTHHAFEPNHTLLILLLATTFLNVFWQASWVLLMATNQHNKISIAFIASSAMGLLSSALLMPYLGINGAGIMLVLFEFPMLYITINSALKLLNDHWFNYLKAVLSNPLKNLTTME
jgi:O-antigen/teichoic acid export membrane protein